MDHELAREYAGLVRQKRALKTDLDAIGERIEEIEKMLLEQFGADGIDKITIAGMNLSPRRELWAATIDGQYDDACDALISTGYGELVQRRFNAQSLSGVVRELDREGQPVPPEWDGLIRVSEVFKISATESKRG